MYQAIIVPHFHKQIKPYLKKYRSLKESLIKTLEGFIPEQHDNLGNSLYKVRLRSKEIPRGKNKSFRVIVLIIEIKKYLVPITIYYKGDRASISQQAIDDQLESVLYELRAIRQMN